MLNIVTYVILKTLFALKMFNIYPDVFGVDGKQLDKKSKVKFKNYDVINWETNNENTHAAQYLQK